MTLRFRLNKSGMFDVVGPADEVKLGLVQVTKKDGTVKTECVIKLGPTFATDQGTYRSGMLRPLPRKPKPRIVDRPQQTPVVTRSADGSTVEIRVDD